MIYKTVYIKMKSEFSKQFECTEFVFNDVQIEDTANYLTLYDKDGTLAFKCCIDDICRFAKC